MYLYTYIYYILLHLCVVHIYMRIFLGKMKADILNQRNAWSRLRPSTKN